MHSVSNSFPMGAFRGHGRPHLVHGLILVTSRIEPSLYNDVNGMLHNDFCDKTRGLVEKKAEVVLQEHGVTDATDFLASYPPWVAFHLRWIRGIRIIEHFVLIVSIDHSG